MSLRFRRRKPQECVRAIARSVVVIVVALNENAVFSQQNIPQLNDAEPQRLEPIREQTTDSTPGFQARQPRNDSAAQPNPFRISEQPRKQETSQRSVNVPLTRTPLPDRTTISANGDLVTLVVRDASLGDVLNAIADQMDLNVVSSGKIDGVISITLNNVPLHDALDAILSVNGYQFIQTRNIIMVSSVDGVTKLSPRVDGRQVRVFHLDFVPSADIEKTVKGLLSPMGSVFSTEIDSADKMRHREELVVEDLPEYLTRVEAYISQADQPPAQVLIEAHVLQVSLRDDNRHGVNIQNIARMANADVTLQTNGIANIDATPAFLLNVNGSQIDSIIEVLQGTTDAKTLASPKVLAVNGQEARIQIGESLGYLTTTTTQTSTVQDVSFLDLGVVLTVTPVISRDGRILMTVKPEVSSGRINASTGLPDSETTEVESTVLLPSGHAMVIGGLIKEENTDQQSKLPIAGNIPVFGKLFQRRNRVKDRSEIIIVVLPRIVPYGELAQMQHSEEVQRATTPLLDGPLIPVDRRQFEPELWNANQYCEPVGKKMRCFPTPPVAYSPYSTGASESLPPLIPGAMEIHTPVPALQMPATPAPMPSEFLPPAANRQHKAGIQDVEQVSGVKNGASAVRTAAGWSRSRRVR